MSRFLLPLLAVLFVALPSSAQLPENDQIIANLKYRIPQLREAEVVIGEIAPSQFDQLHQGSFSVNGRETYRFLIAENPARLLILLAEPIDISLSSASVATLLEEEDRQMVAAAQDRHEALGRFATGMPARGAADAPITIYEFSDFQCPYCARATDVLDELLEKRPDDVRLVYLHLPLSMHDWAMPAAVAATCAADQNESAFWLLHDRYFEHQQSILLNTVLAQSREWLQESAQIDMDTWESCASDTESAANQSAVLRIEVSVATSERMGATGTPAFFVNGHFLNGIQPIETFEELIDDLLAERNAED